MSEGERIQKLLARAGFGSRRACEELISNGRVSVNGQTAVLGARANADDSLKVDGVPVSTDVDSVYWLLNKPVGIISTSDDEHGRETIIALVPSEPRVFSVGRLDSDTSGLLILTNDGEFANRIAHPSHGVVKEYFAELDSTPSDSGIVQLRQGIELDDGLTAPAHVARIGDKGLKIEIHEGRNRQVRRMCSAIGCEVVRLIRTRIGPIADRGLQEGDYRELSPSEVRALNEMAARKDKTNKTMADKNR